MSSLLNRRRMLITGSAALAGVGLQAVPAAHAEGIEFVPRYARERGDWVFQSYLLQPALQDLLNAPGSTIAARKWASGKLTLQDDGKAGAAHGTLTLGADVELQISINGKAGHGIIPATFEAVAEGTGQVAGMRYLLNGWAIRGNNGLLSRMHGSIMLVSGPHDSPAFEPGPDGMPVMTVGTFTVTA